MQIQQIPFSPDTLEEDRFGGITLDFAAQVVDMYLHGAGVPQGIFAPQRLIDFCTGNIDTGMLKEIGQDAIFNLGQLYQAAIGHDLMGLRIQLKGAYLLLMGYILFHIHAHPAKVGLDLG